MTTSIAYGYHVHPISAASLHISLSTDPYCIRSFTAPTLSNLVCRSVAMFRTTAVEGIMVTDDRLTDFAEGFEFTARTKAQPFDWKLLAGIDVESVVSKLFQLLLCLDTGTVTLAWASEVMSGITWVN